MELRARILLIISISSLVLYISVEGLNILPSLAQRNSKVDDVNQLEKNQGLQVFNEPKEAFNQDKEAKQAISPITDESETPISSRPVSSPVSDLDKEAKQAISPITDESETPISSRPVSSPVSDLDKAAPSPSSLWGGISGFIGNAEKLTVNEAEAVSSSIFGHSKDNSTPVPSPLSGPIPYPNPPDSGPAPSSFSGPAPYLNPPDSGLAPSSFSGPVPYPNTPSFSPGLGPGPAPSAFFDHDVALAIEARIKQSQSNAQLAMDEAKKLISDPNVASSETGKCLSECVDKYGTSLNQLNRAITDLGVRDVTLLANDFGAVETDISTCQACFTENIGEDSPLKSLEEATAKAVRECLTVMDYAA